MRKRAEAAKLAFWTLLLVLLGFRLVFAGPDAVHSIAMKLAARAAPPAPVAWMGHDFRILREHLSSQDEEPFLFRGEVMDSGRPQWEQFGPAIRDYPDTLSCLRPEEREAERPNLLAFDWHRVDGLSVCLFRVASSLGSPKRMSTWMEANAMRMRPPLPGIGEPGAQGTAIMGHWTLDEATRRSSVPPSLGIGLVWLKQALLRLENPGHDESLSYRVDFAPDNRVVGVSLGVSYPLYESERN